MEAVVNGQMELDLVKINSSPSNKPLSNTAKDVLKILRRHTSKEHAIHGKDLALLIGVDIRTITEYCGQIAISKDLDDLGLGLCSNRMYGYWLTDDPEEYRKNIADHERENVKNQCRTNTQKTFKLAKKLVSQNDD